MAESKGIKIYFFIPPRLRNDQELETVFPIYQKLDKKYKLGADHFNETLYREETSLDELHLNFAGAAMFTEKASEAFNRHEGFSPVKTSVDKKGELDKFSEKFISEF